MGENTLPAPLADGDTITADSINAAGNALRGDLVPRNAAGAPESGAGSLGTESKPGDGAYFNSLHVGGSEITASGGGGSSVTLRTGVENAESPAAYPGGPGFLYPAGANGVRISASEDDPLVVRVAGTRYQLTEERTGGTPINFESTINGNFKLTVSPFSIDHNGLASGVRTGTSGTFGAYTGTAFGRYEAVCMKRNGDYNITLKNLPRRVFRYASNAVSFQTDTRYDISFFRLHTANIGASTWTPSPRINARDGHVTARFRQIGGGLNTSSRLNTSTNTTYTVLPVSHVFVDPTDDWAITIEERVVGFVDQDSPEISTGQLAAGYMVYSDTEQKWCRWSGSAWMATNRIYLGMAVVENNAVAATCPVWAAEKLNALHKLVHGNDSIAQRDAAASEIIRVSFSSYPSWVPSASMELTTISPAPSFSAYLAHATASMPVLRRPPWVTIS